MTDLRIIPSDKEYKNQISDIIQGELIDLYGANGYKSIMQTMMRISRKAEREIITNFELFAGLSEGVFGKVSESKILEPIKMKIDIIGIENIHQEEKIEIKSMRVLIADDEIEILSLYKEFLESKGREVITATDGRKCVDAYKRFNHNQSENYFDVVILDQKMPFMTGLQAAVEILNINPQQKIIFASGYLEKTLLEVLTKLNKAIAVIEKPFSLDVLDYMINNSEIFERLEKININQEEKDITQKMSEIMTVLQNPI
ncbi:MAG: response regulator [Nitrosopumilus sp.]|nr:response regulator [Nitrosopumilus sp.]